MYLVTVVIPYYSAAGTINRALKSIFAQTDLPERSIEIIVIDDCSPQSLKSQMAFSHPDMKIVTLPYNQGSAQARNKGLEIAKGRFIAFCDSDDYWEPNKLCRQIDFMLKNDHYFTYTSYYKCFESIGREVVVEAPDSQSYNDLIRSCAIGCSTVVIDTGYLDETIKMPNMRRRQDYATWLYLTKKFGPAYGIKEPLTRYTISKGSISRNKIVAAQQHYQVLCMFEANRLNRLYYFLIYFLKGTIKYLKF